jgi:uncharacterized membrane protein YagU involved in acid resistance
VTGFLGSVPLGLMMRYGNPEPLVALALAVAVGVLTTAVLSVLVMPLWLGAVGYPFTPAFPDLSMLEKLWSVLGHVVYALPMTAGYALVARTSGR